MQLFFDMDGVLAKFYSQSKKPLEDMYKEGYFLSLKPYALARHINELAKINNNINIVSACINSQYCEDEKRAWLRRYMPNIPEQKQWFCKQGDNKADIVMDAYPNNDILVLVDDYSYNLYQWEIAGGISIKFINEINNKKGNRYKYTFRRYTQLQKIIKEINGNGNGEN